MDPRDEGEDEALALGPRGGRTTVGGGGLLVRKSFYLSREGDRWLRREASERGMSEAELIREMLVERYHLLDG